MQRSPPARPGSRCSEPTAAPPGAFVNGAVRVALAPGACSRSRAGKIVKREMVEDPARLYELDLAILRDQLSCGRESTSDGFGPMTIGSPVDLGARAMRPLQTQNMTYRITERDLGSINAASSERCGHDSRTKIGVCHDNRDSGLRQARCSRLGRVCRVFSPTWRGLLLRSPTS